MMFGGVTCDLCRSKFPASEFDGGGAVVLMGKKICSRCVQKKTLYCHFCRAAIRESDFDAGKAVTLLGKRYCEACLAAAVERSKPSKTGDTSLGRPIDVPASPIPAARREPSAGITAEAPTGAQARAFERFVPPREARLFIKPPGLNGMFGTNRVRMWLDLSEGGVRAIVEGSFETGEEVDGEVRFPPDKVRIPVVLKVRHVHPSKSSPDCFVVGFKFVDPDRELRDLIRNKLRQFPLLGEMESEAPAPRAAAERPPAPQAG
jgi:hypothetical protein